jgi:hypothetical protein
LAAGKTITYELMNTLIRTDTLAMEIAEIEGDAIFFVKRKSIPSPEAMFLQFEAMKSAFDAKVRMLQARYGFELNLTLKAVAHYGEISEFRIKGFRKFYG